MYVQYVQYDHFFLLVLESIHTEMFLNSTNRWYRTTSTSKPATFVWPTILICVFGQVEISKIAIPVLSSLSAISLHCTRLVLVFFCFLIILLYLICMYVLQTHWCVHIQYICSAPFTIIKQIDWLVGWLIEIMVFDLRRSAEFSAGLQEMNLSGTSSLTVRLNQPQSTTTEAPRLILASINLSTTILTNFLEISNTYILDSLDTRI